MLVIVADGYEDALELGARRDRFTCSEFSYSIAPDERSGVLLLLPERRAVIVSSNPADYTRAWVFTPKAALVGIMTCELSGRVRWLNPPGQQ